MPLLNSQERYGLLSVSLHWLMLLLLAAVYACIELREIYPKGSEPREALKAWHFMLGLSVLPLLGLRILLRMGSPTPRIEPAPPDWQARSARLGHLALYGLMLAMPLAGWLILSANDKPIPFFGWQWPPLMQKNPDLARLIKDLHESGGTLGYYLIGGHALAGLFHHYVMRDNTLRRMLP